MDNIRLANLLQITVWFNFNDVKVHANPGGDPEDVEKRWDRALKSKSTIKIA